MPACRRAPARRACARGRAQAVLLPQVATEQGFGVEAFLNAVCHKAGLTAGSWREPATHVFTFTADVFIE